MRLPTPRGPISTQVIALARGTSTVPAPRAQAPTSAVAGATEDVVLGEDFQLALWVAYECHFGGFEDATPDVEWNVRLLDLRGQLEAAFEEHLRQATAAMLVPADPGRIEQQLTELVSSGPDAGLAAFLHREATAEQFLDFLRSRSIYHLKESDPSSFLLARLHGPAKVALAELQYDEYGGGRPERLHQHLFAEGMRALGLDADYGRYIDEVDAATLAVNNVGSLFALHRRLRGAAAGHLAAFEATSSIPCRRIGQGIKRLGLADEMFAYYDEHVEADAVHEQVAIGDICGALVRDEPEVADDVLFGAAACLRLDAVAGRALLQRWFDATPAADDDTPVGADSAPSAARTPVPAGAAS